jgi:excisionase family DNA binding protein
MKKSFTTSEAANVVKISRASLQEWIRRGKIVAPPVRLVEGKAVRVWTARDVQKLRKVKSEIYGQGKGKRRAS